MVVHRRLALWTGVVGVVFVCFWAICLVDHQPWTFEFSLAALTIGVGSLACAPTLLQAERIWAQCLSWLGYSVYFGSTALLLGLGGAFLTQPALLERKNGELCPATALGEVTFPWCVYRQSDMRALIL